MEEHIEQMKAFILMTEDLVRSEDEVEPLLEAMTPHRDEGTRKLIGELRDLLFKLRSYQEDADDDAYALGVEAGMIKASDMVENVVKRFADGGDEHIG